MLAGCDCAQGAEMPLWLDRAKEELFGAFWHLSLTHDMLVLCEDSGQDLSAHTK